MDYIKTVKFLAELKQNNSKEWMDAHRKEYKEIRLEYELFISQLISELSKFDPTLEWVNAKECIFRLNRNLRFSPDKTPYKTHFGAFIAIKGRNSGYCGYYIHIEPNCETNAGYSLTFGNSMLAVGNYAPHPIVLKSIREEFLVNGAEVKRIIAKAKDYTFSTEDSLKRTPQGFPTGTPNDDLLRLKSFGLRKKLDPDYFTCDCLAAKIACDLRPTIPLVNIINRAVEYAYEEMM